MARTKRAPVLGLLAAAVLFAACTDDARVDDLEARIARIERSLATTMPSTTTTTVPLEEVEVPPIAMPFEQARTRLQRRLPAELTDLWQAEWCRDHPAALGEAAAAAGVPGFPARPTADDLDRLLADDPDAFGEVCASAIDAAEPGSVAATDYDDAVEAAVAAAAAEIVGEAIADTSTLEASLERLTPQERSFCSANLEAVFDAAFAAGRLPQGAAPELERYWSVVRPDEFAAACRIAAGTR